MSAKNAWRPATTATATCIRLRNRRLFAKFTRKGHKQQINLTPVGSQIEGNQAIAAVKNTTGDGYFILIPVSAIDYGAPNNFTNKLTALKINENGLNIFPIETDLGDFRFSIYSEIKSNTYLGSTKIAIAPSSLPGPTRQSIPITKIYSFNASTGHSEATLATISGVMISSVEFSKNGNLLYAMVNHFGSQDHRLVVYDLNNIASGYRTISNSQINLSLQRAADGNIYFTNVYQNNKLFKISDDNSFLNSQVSSSVLTFNVNNQLYFNLPQLVQPLSSGSNCDSLTLDSETGTSDQIRATQTKAT